MRTANQFLILTVIVTFFTIPAIAKDDPSLPENLPRPLIGRPHPVLAGIKGLHVNIAMPEAWAKKYNLALKDLKSKIEIKLTLRGIAQIPLLYNGRMTTSPELRVDISVLRLDNSQQHVFSVQTSLARSVHLATQPKLGFQADVWKANAVMQAASVQNMAAEVTKVTLAQVDEFIADYRAANPPGKRIADTNDITAVLPVVTPRETKPAIKPPTDKYKYLASKNSKVFHKSDCHWAKRIKPTNLVTFGTRDKATEAGKRPCKQCKP
jgi:hypothetical protein